MKLNLLFGFGTPDQAGFEQLGYDRSRRGWNNDKH
jgi:hypothetical protein